jgi:hypothetical protein
MPKDKISEAKEICKIVREGLPDRWDGKECILELKNANYQWKQMEWIGWYFEYKAIDLLQARFGSNPGPSFGLTKFDFKLNYVWDFKTHPTNPPASSSGRNWVIVNDKEAIDKCSIKFEGLGVVMAEGEAEYDDSTASFKSWHDSLKGGRSDYENERIKRGAPSRQRKKAFNLSKLEAIWLDKSILNTGLEHGWVSLFQEGMRNADGSKWRAKYSLNLEKLPYEARLASI